MHYLRQVVIVSLAADPAILQLQLGGATEGTLPSGLPPRPVERQLYDCPRLAGEAARHLEPHVAIGLEWALAKAPISARPRDVVAVGISSRMASSV
jgi:hypothetical protein